LGEIVTELVNQPAVGEKYDPEGEDDEQKIVVE